MQSGLLGRPIERGHFANLTQLTQFTFLVHYSMPLINLPPGWHYEYKY